jgi:hypothetical protein
MRRFLTVAVLLSAFSLASTGCGNDSNSTRLNPNNGGIAQPGRKKPVPDGFKENNPGQQDHSQSPM